MGLDDQKEEREVLDSIFPDEITDVSKTEFRISIQLDDGRHEDEKTSIEQPLIVLNVQYPPNYPDEAPRLEVTQPPNAPKHPYLDIQEDKTRLLNGLADTIEENMGMAMIFTLVTVLKDSAELLITERRNAKQALVEIQAAQAEEEENKKFQGEAVTRETFLAWRERFRREMENEAKRREEEKELEDKKKKVAKEDRKLTGRELWERGMVGKVDDDEEEEESQEMDISKLKIEATS